MLVLTLQYGEDVQYTVRGNVSEFTLAKRVRGHKKDGTEYWAPSSSVGGSADPRYPRLEFVVEAIQRDVGMRIEAANLEEAVVYYKEMMRITQSIFDMLSEINGSGRCIAGETPTKRLDRLGRARGLSILQSQRKLQAEGKVRSTCPDE